MRRKKQSSPRSNTGEEDEVRYYLKSIGPADLLTAEEEVALSQRIRAGDLSALREFVRRNLRLVVSLAKTYQHRGVDFIDLILAGNLGLMRAAVKFDPASGHRFSTYAFWWIKKELKDCVKSYPRMVHIPSNQLTGMNRVRRIVQRLEVELDRAPTNEEVWSELEKQFPGRYDLSDALRLLSYLNRMTVSIDASGRQEGEEGGWAATIANPRTVSPYALVVQEEEALLLQRDIESFRQAVLELPPFSRSQERDTQIFFLAVGLHGSTPKHLTLRMIAKIYSLNRESVRRIRDQVWRCLDHRPKFEGNAKAWLFDRMKRLAQARVSLEGAPVDPSGPEHWPKE